MCGKNIGAVSLVDVTAGKTLTKYHCIIHQQILCRKVSDYDHVMSVVVSVVNYIRARGLKTFCLFLEEIESANFEDLLYHIDVC